MALTRGLPAGLVTALGGHFHPVILVEADWPSEMIRIHSGRGDISWNSLTWSGVGRLVQFAAPEEQMGPATARGEIHVAATVADMLADRGKVIRNRSINVWIGATTTAAGNTLATDPGLFFTGYFDGRSARLAREGEHLSHDMVLPLGIGPGARTPTSISHTYEDQITAYPGDTAGRHVQTMVRRSFNPPQWPAP